MFDIHSFDKAFIEYLKEHGVKKGFFITDYGTDFDVSFDRYIVQHPNGAIREEELLLRFCWLNLLTVD